MRSVTYPLAAIVPISLAKVGSQFYSTLNGYKNSPHSGTRDEYTLRLGALLARFLRDHHEHVETVSGRWDTITIVPSSSGRAGPHPLENVVLKARAHHPLYRPLLRAGAVELDHRAGDDRGFDLSENADGRHVLLIDDTFTTGARIHSAASALRLAGADVTAAVVLGRIVRPDYSDEARELWDQQTAIPFDFSVCCLE
jgi:hypothetical protein